MGIRRKFLLLAFAAFLLMIALMYVSAQVIVLRSFADLEVQTLNRNLERVSAAISNERADMSATTADYSYWDDTYQFMLGNQPEYLDVNLHASTLTNLGFHLVTLFDLTGKAIFTKAIDLETGEETSPPDDLNAYLASASGWLEQAQTAEGVTGMVQVSKGAYLVAARPILTSNGDGPPVGIFVWGRHFDEEKVSELANDLKLSLATYPLSDPRVPASFTSATAVNELNADTIVGYLRLDDFTGRPIRALEIQMPRQIYREGWLALSFFMTTAFIACAAAMIGVFVFANRIVVSPIRQLSHLMTEVGKTNDLSPRVPVRGGDEITTLQSGFNTMLQSMQESQRHLQEANERLERRVEERTHELVQAKEQAEAILHNATDPIVLTDAQGTILQTNAAFLCLFQISPEAVTGKTVAELADPERARLLMDALHTALTGEPQRLELELPTTAGTTFTAEIALAGLGDGIMTTGRAIWTVHDISERKRAEEQLKHALDTEKQLNAMKSRFVSTLSHEFRTPLASIQVSSDLLNLYGDRLSPEKKRDQYEQIQGQIKRLTGMIDDVLTVDRANTTTLAIHPEMIDLTAFCREIVADVTTAFGDSHEVQMVACGPERSICLDPKLMRQTISNLLSNAMKYSPKETDIYLNVTFEPESVQIQVVDQGIGIPLVDQAHLFEVFHRAGNVGTIEGTGLGLVIVKHAVELHGGTIAVASQPDEGTTFTITLPTDNGHAGE